jgi:transportin-3
VVANLGKWNRKEDRNRVWKLGSKLLSVIAQKSKLSGGHLKQTNMATEQVFAALTTLYDPNSSPELRHGANKYLESFRREVRLLLFSILRTTRTNASTGQTEAWSTSNLIIQSPDAPPPAKLFAAQTFRAKVRVSLLHSTAQPTFLFFLFFFELIPRTQIQYDLGDLSLEARLGLRDSLLSVLTSNSSSSRVLVRQLCLSLADLLLQIPEWTNAVQGMIEQFGRSPEAVPALLEFLTVLPQENNDHRRLDITVKFP